jgi:hypothetical protein
MSKPSQCPACSESNLSPVTNFKTQSTNKSVELVFQGPDSSWADSGKRSFAANRGCACLDCGYVMVLLAEDALAALRAEVRTLAPTDPT